MGANSSSSDYIKYSQASNLSDRVTTTIEDFYKCENDTTKLIEFFIREFSNNTSREDMINALKREHWKVSDCYHYVNERTVTLVIRFYSRKSKDNFIRRIIFSEI